MVAEPALTPVTLPELPTVATAGLEELQTPPVVASESVMEAPAHTVEGPEMVPAEGERFTVSGVVLMAEPHEVV